MVERRALAALLRTLRANGVTSYDDGNVKLTLDPSHVPAKRHTPPAEELNYDSPDVDPLAVLFDHESRGNG